MGIRESIARAARGGIPATIVAVVMVLALSVAPTSAWASEGPSVTNVAPATGPVSGGTELHIGGTNFTGATEVRFGSTPASFTVNSSSKIEAIAPPGAEGTVDVTVTTPEGTSEITRADHFSYVPPGPAVVEVRPAEGTAAGNLPVSILGAHFEHVMEVTFGAASASFSVVSPEHLDATTPPGEAPTVNVRVTTLEGISPVWPGDEYQYKIKTPEIASVSPNFGPAAGGTEVTIVGEEFYGVTGVEFGTVAATSFTVNSPTSITAVAPAHTVEKTAIKVLTNFGPSAPEYCQKNKGKRVKCSAAGNYKFKEATVTKVSPESGPTAGGTDVTITGTGFGLGPGQTEIVIGKGVATSVDCTSTTTCTAITPPAAKPSKAYVKVTVHSNEGGNTKKNPAAAFHYE
jgi:hypothetical protein